MKNLSKIVLSCLILGLSVSVCHARVVVGVGMNYGPGYYAPQPCYYGPPPCYAPPQVAWVPGHWECGYWVPSHYIQYAAPAPAYVQPAYYGPSYGYSYTTSWGRRGGCHGGYHHHGHHGHCR